MSQSLNSYSAQQPLANIIASAKATSPSIPPTSDTQVILIPNIHPYISHSNLSQEAQERGHPEWITGLLQLDFKDLLVQFCHSVPVQYNDSHIM